MKSEHQLLSIDLSLASKEVIEILLDGAAENKIFYEVFEQNKGRPEILEVLFNNSLAPGDIHEKVASILHLPVKAMAFDLTVQKRAEIKKEKEETLVMRIQKLTVGEKFHLAMLGDRTIRTMLLRDPSREVVLRTLSNPKITESEIEMAAKSRSIPEEALRKICKHREWLKNYSILTAIVSNPKTPTGAAIPLISRLRVRDLNVLSKNKFIPGSVRSVASKILKEKRPV